MCVCVQGGTREGGGGEGTREGRGPGRGGDQGGEGTREGRKVNTVQAVRLLYMTNLRYSIVVKIDSFDVVELPTMSKMDTE